MKNLKKILGLFLAAILLTTSVGTSTAQAISWKEWPYGKYKGVATEKWDTFSKNNRIEWGYGSDAPDEYDESISMYKKGSTTRTEMSFKRVSKNKYKSKVYKYEITKDKYYCIIKLKGKYLYFYWYDQKKNGKYKKTETFKYKRYKVMSKNVS